MSSTCSSLTLQICIRETKCLVNQRHAESRNRTKEKLDTPVPECAQIFRQPLLPTPEELGYQLYRTERNCRKHDFHVSHKQRDMTIYGLQLE